MPNPSSRPHRFEPLLLIVAFALVQACDDEGTDKASPATDAGQQGSGDSGVGGSAGAGGSGGVGVGGSAGATLAACPEIRPEITGQKRLEVTRTDLRLSVTTTDLSIRPTTSTAYAAASDGLYRTDNISDPVPIWNRVTVAGRAPDDPVNAVVASGARVYLGVDTASAHDLYVLDAADALEHTEPLPAGVTRLARDTAGGHVYAGLRTGDVWRNLAGDGVSWAQVATSPSGAHVANIALASSGAARVGRGSFGDWAVSADGASFTEETINFAHWPGEVLFWRSGSESFLIGAVNAANLFDAVYTCDDPCLDPVILGDSGLMQGSPNGPNGVAHPEIVLTADGKIVVVTGLELWISEDDGQSFQLVVNLFDDCSEPPLHNAIASENDVYLATALGVLRLSL